MHCSWLKRRAEHPTTEHSCLPHDKHPGTSDCYTLGEINCHCRSPCDYLLLTPFSHCPPRDFLTKQQEKKALIMNLKHSAQMCVLTASFSLMLG